MARIRHEILTAQNPVAYHDRQKKKGPIDLSLSVIKGKWQFFLLGFFPNVFFFFFIKVIEERNYVLICLLFTLRMFIKFEGSVIKGIIIRQFSKAEKKGKHSIFFNIKLCVCACYYRFIRSSSTVMAILEQKHSFFPINTSKIDCFHFLTE